MSRRNPWRLLLSIGVSALLVGCGGNTKENANAKTKANGNATGEAPSAASARPSGNGACALLMQAEVDEIFRTSVGAGASETLEDGSQLCSWPANEDAALLLQVGPPIEKLAEAVALGKGYRVSDLAGMSGPAALTIQEASGDIKAQVAVVALKASDRTVILSPIGLGVEEGSDRFERLKSLVELVAQRL
jgi:hypothetical protein